MSSNRYRLPVPEDSIVRVSHESPYHVGDLIHSIDFIVSEGTPVFAAFDGEVIDFKDDSKKGGDSPEDEQFGNFIEIQHPNEEYSEYEHLAFGTVKVKKGDKVKKGQLIARSGATGVLAGLGPHLHFMVGHYRFESIRIDYEEPPAGESS